MPPPAAWHLRSRAHNRIQLSFPGGACKPDRLNEVEIREVEGLYTGIEDAWTLVNAPGPHNAASLFADGNRWLMGDGREPGGLAWQGWYPRLDLLQS